MPTNTDAPAKLRTLALIGERYLAGLAAYRALLTSPDIELTHIVLPSEKRWRRFDKALMGPEYGAPARPWHVRYAQALGVVPMRDLLRGALRELLSEDTDDGQMPAVELTPPPPIPPLVVDSANDAELIARVEADRPDVVFVGAFPQILSRSWTSIAARCTINNHTAPLPRQRGSQAIWWSIVDGEAEMGVTVHRLEAELDGGDILVQTRAPMAPTTAGYLAWLDHAIEQTIHEAFRVLLTNSEQWRPQERDDSTVHRWPRAIHRKLDWDVEDTAQIVRKVRAGALPYPIRAFFLFANRPIEAGEACARDAESYLTNDISPAPGTVLAVGDDWLDLSTLDGVVRLSDLTLDGLPVRCHHLATIGSRAM